MMLLMLLFNFILLSTTWFQVNISYRCWNRILYMYIYLFIYLFSIHALYVIAFGYNQNRIKL